MMLSLRRSIQGNGECNIHAGRGSWDSQLCPIIGNSFVQRLLPTKANRHAYPELPDEPEGVRYTAYGFESSDSLKAQVEFNGIFSCAERILKKKPSVSYKLASSSKPPSSGWVREPDSAN